MLCADETTPTYPLGAEVENDPVCEFCLRSLVTRFGGWAPVECDSCRDEMRLLSRAGKLKMVAVAA